MGAAVVSWIGDVYVPFQAGVRARAVGGACGGAFAAAFACGGHAFASSFRRAGDQSDGSEIRRARCAAATVRR